MITPSRIRSMRADTEAGARLRRSARASLLRVVLRRDRAAAAGTILIAALLALAICGPWLAPQDPLHQDLAARRAGPGPAHPLGTDDFGRDLLSRLLAGARYTLGASALAVALGVVTGAPLGLAMGYFGGRLDRVSTRFLDVLLGFPYLLLAIVIVGVLGPSLGNAMLAVGITSLPIYARVVRSETLARRNREFVTAAVALGGSGWHAIRRHIVPNVLGSLIVVATVGMANAIQAIAGLSFLGLGAQPPTPEWGSMLSTGRTDLMTAPHVATVPGVAVVIAMLTFNLVGDALRDALDPQMR